MVYILLYHSLVSLVLLSFLNGYQLHIASWLWVEPVSCLVSQYGTSSVLEGWSYKALWIIYTSILLCLEDAVFLESSNTSRSYDPSDLSSLSLQLCMWGMTGHWKRQLIKDWLLQGFFNRCTLSGCGLWVNPHLLQDIHIRAPSRAGVKVSISKKFLFYIPFYM